MVIIYFFIYIILVIIKCRLIVKITRVGDGSLLNRNEKEKNFFKLFLKRKLFKYLCKSNNVYIHILTNSCLDIIDNFSKNIIVFLNLLKKANLIQILKKKILLFYHLD